MHIYLKKSEELTKEIVINLQRADWAQNTLFGKTVYDLQSNPFLSEMIEDFEILNANPLLKPFFLKATIVSFPNFRSLDGATIRSVQRIHGIYQLGKAKAELIPSNNKGGDSGYWLKIETSSWEGIADMAELQKRLWAGTIAPTISYDRVQQQQNIFQVLAEVLSLHKLSPIKRFFLALRLTKVS